MAEKKNKPTADDFEGATDLAFLVSNLQSEADDYAMFAEDVLLSVIMPDVPRFMLEDKYKGHMADSAAAELFRHMEGYRKILDFLRRNGIDVNTIIGDGDEKKKS